MEVWLWFHLIAMAFFVGGQIVFLAAVLPVFRGDEDKTRLRAIARRFASGSLVALGVLIVSGSAMASDGDHWSDSALHVKLALVALTAGLVLWHMKRPHQHAVEGIVFVLSLTIVALGIAVAE